MYMVDTSSLCGALSHFHMFMYREAHSKWHQSCKLVEEILLGYHIMIMIQQNEYDTSL
jgi:hypothetical protein